MKKLNLLLLAGAMFGLSACDDGTQIIDPWKMTADVFVVCNGQGYNGIPGSITAYNPLTFTATPNAFSKVNGRYLGTSVEYATISGDYIYIISSSENTVEVADKKTLTSVGTFKTVEEFGEKGNQPRQAVAHGDNIYVTTFAGYVVSFNAKTLKKGESYLVGNYPEGICSDGENTLYVANSNYGKGVDASISAINLKTGEVSDMTDEKINNPYSIFWVDKKLIVLDRGTYDESWNQVGAALLMRAADGSWKKLTDATMAAVDGQTAVVCNAPFHTPVLTPTYSRVDLMSGEVKALPKVEVDSPAFIGFNFWEGRIYVGSYTVDPETHYANYSSDGYVTIFNADGDYISKFNCGVGPMDICFSLD